MWRPSLRLSALVVAVATLFVLGYAAWKLNRRSINLRYVARVRETAHRSSSTSGATPRPILAADRLSVAYSLNGALFGPESGPLEFFVNASTSLVYSFSPSTERHFRNMMVDPPKEHRIYANSPAIVWHKEQLVVVMRMWLEKEKYELTAKRTKNRFSDNYFYARSFDDHFRPVDAGRVIGIPTPNQWSIGDGPIEPRAVVVDGSLYLTFNTGAILSDGTSIDSTFMWDYDKNEAILPSIEGGAPMQLSAAANEMPRDKHWSALLISGKLFFTYNLDPLRVLRCTATNGSCYFVHFDGPRNYKFDDNVDALRGGTPFVQYMGTPFFVSVVHVTLFKNCPRDSNCHGKRYYTANVLVLRAEPFFKVAYCSAPLQFHERILDSIPIVRFKYIKDPFVFPVGLIIEDADTLAIGAHVNDHSSVVFRFRGLRQIMNRVSSTDGGEEIGGGPTLGGLHEWARLAAKRHSGRNFL